VIYLKSSAGSRQLPATAKRYPQFHMSTIEILKQSELEINKLIILLENADRAKEEKRLREQFKRLNDHQNKSVRKYLEANDIIYNSLTKENFDLMINDHIEFVVTSEDWGIFKSHATELNGEVHNNGFFYAQTTKTDFALFNFQKSSYPLGYQCIVNYLGEVDLTISNRGYVFFGGRVPQKYIGSIDSKGNIQMKTTETYWEHDGSIYVNKIIGDFFSGNSEKRKKFLDNKDQMETKISIIRTSLI
jgi:hypothetical protein